MPRVRADKWLRLELVPVTSPGLVVDAFRKVVDEAR